jgi:uncharacterized protein
VAGRPRRPGPPAEGEGVDSGTVRPPGPVRTCVGCRERAARADLLRVVVVEGRLVPDPRRRLPGRGASVHPVQHCVDLAVRRRAFPRALRLPGPLDATELLAAVHAVGQASPQQDAPVPSRKQVEKPHERSMSPSR